jgi:hypothetical protein
MTRKVDIHTPEFKKILNESGIRQSKRGRGGGVKVQVDQKIDIENPNQSHRNYRQQEIEKTEKTIKDWEEKNK